MPECLGTAAYCVRVGPCSFEPVSRWGRRIAVRVLAIGDYLPCALVGRRCATTVRLRTASGP